MNLYYFQSRVLKNGVENLRGAKPESEWMSSLRTSASRRSITRSHGSKENIFKGIDQAKV